MDTPLEGTYSGRIDPCNDNGGTCDLDLTGGKFELRILLNAPYSIEDGTTVRGTYTENAESVTLHAHELYNYTWETTKQEHTASSSRVLVAAFAGPGPDRANVLDILIDAQRPVLLLRESPRTGIPKNADLLAWFDAACARRRAAAETLRTRRFDEHASVLAATAFQAKDYPRVIMLLEPREERVSPADRKKLAFARRRLKEMT